MDRITEQLTKNMAPDTREAFLKLLKKAEKDYDLRILQKQNVQPKDV